MAFPAPTRPDLNQVRERGLGDPRFFEPEAQSPDKPEDRFYALIYDRLWDTMLPALERVGGMLILRRAADFLGGASTHLMINFP